MYLINWQKFIKDRLLSPLRKIKLISFIQALITPVISLDAKFGAFRAEIEECVRVTGQVRILRHYLNQTFDPVNETIEILDYTEDNTVFMFTESESQPLYLPKFLNDTIFGFEVRLPSSLQPEEPKVRAVIDKFKLAGKKYILTYI